MPLPTSGSLSASQINVELKRASTASFSMNGSSERGLAEKIALNSQISFNDFYGKLLFSNGTLDITFLHAREGARRFDEEFGFSPGTLESFVRQSDGKIILVGSFNRFDTFSKINVVRLHSNGVYDSSFNQNGVGGRDFTSMNDVVVQTDNKLIVCGDSFYNNVNLTKKIFRLHANGVHDASFNNATSSEISQEAFVYKILLLPNGRVLVAGTVTGGIIRLFANGLFDSSSFSGSRLVDGFIKEIASQSDGKFIVGGEFSRYGNATLSGRGGIARINSNALLDTSFVTGTGFSTPQGGGPAVVNTIAIQADQKVIVGGFFQSYSGVSANTIIRLHPNGIRDTSFPTNNFVSQARINDIEIQSNGRIVVGGEFTSYGGVTVNRIARLNANGSLDTTFSVGTGFNQGEINKISILPDGKLLIGGRFFTTYKGTTVRTIVQLAT